MNISQAFRKRTPEPVTCSGYELASVLAGIRARGGFVNGLEAGVGGKNAMYSVSYFGRVSDKPMPNEQRREEKCTTHALKGVAAGSAGIKPKIVNDEPACISIESRLNALQQRLRESGKLKRSKQPTQQHHARLPHPSD